MQQHPTLLPIFVVSVLLTAAACGSAIPPASPAKPATAEPVTSESNLLRIVLTPDAERRLALATVRVVTQPMTAVRRTAGEIVHAPIGPSGIPTGSDISFVLRGAQQATASSEVGRAKAAVKLAQIAHQRAEALVAEEAGSLRARDEAAAQLAVAQAALTAAIAQRDLLGPDLAALQRHSRLWLRVPVFGTDISRILSDRSVSLADLGDTRQTRAAEPVAAPPSANTAAGTIDLFYTFDNRDQAYRLGQRVLVGLPLKGIEQALSLPASAIVRDIHGGEWVYRKLAAHRYQRQRVEVAQNTDGQVMLARGLNAGDEVVTAGAAELFGFEFGTGR